MAESKTPSRQKSSKTAAGSRAKKGVESRADKAENAVTEKASGRSVEAMAPAPMYADIANLAYQKFEAHGHQHGRDLEDWVEAERELLATRAAGDKRSARKQSPRT